MTDKKKNATIKDIAKLCRAIQAAGFNTFVIGHASDALVRKLERERKVQIRKVRRAMKS